jgi:ATP-dependent helicase/nuclease subunit A
MLKPKDSGYRDSIEHNLDDSMMVEAGAGSGKTTSLVKRMLALIGSGKCAADRMAAVTFTRKAAADLMGRFQIALEEAVKEEENDARRTRYQAALTKMGLLFSGTIHSFCARLLRERPVEAGLDPDFRELEEDENMILRDRCWSEYLENLHAGDAPILDHMVGLGLDPAQLIGTYRNVALYPEVEVAHQKQERPDFTEERARLTAYLDQAWKAMPREIPENGWDDLQKILRQARLRVRHLDLSEDSNLVKVLRGLDKSTRVTQYKWPDRETAKAQLAAFERFGEEVVAPCLERWRVYCHPFIMALVVPAVDYFKQVREKNSQMNFQDLLLKAAELLRTNLEVRRYFKKRFTHILVDEFQDTDPIQAEVLLTLTGEAGKNASWRDVKVRPGSLFIVGDPKQSIYRFRRADIDTYNEVKRIITNSGGRLIPLTTNFRSLPAVCEWINPVFEERFPKETTPCQPAFEPLVPFKTTKGGGVKRITTHKVKGNAPGVVAKEDAKQIASFINRALKKDARILDEEKGEEGRAGKPSPSDFLILLRYKGHLPVYARALEALGIPYEISGGGSFKDSEELRHLNNLLAAVAEPEDQVALIAVLRGNLYGLSDDLLFRYRNGGGVFSYLAPRGGCGDEEARDKVEKVFSEIRQFHQWARTKPPAAALSMILDRLGVIPLALTREMGKSRAGNILKAIEIAFFESARGLTSFAGLAERLAQYCTELEVEEMAVEPGKADAVRIMNLHKAKGLEGRVVFLADPLKDAFHEPELHIRRVEGKPVGYFVASCQMGEYMREIVGTPPDWREYEKIEKAYQEAEEERLLYVAATRAKELLAVSRYPDKSERGAWKDLYPYLDEVEELASPEETPTALGKGKIVPEDFAKGKKRTAEGFAASKEPSYEIETVTRRAEGAAVDRPFSEDSGKGMAWGRVIHRMLEALGRKSDVSLNLLAENLLKEEERSVSEKESVLATVRGVLSSELWKRMKAAEQAFVEIPFSHKVEGAGKPKVVSGVIDLAFKEKGEWVIADYKTDTADGNLEQLVAYYTPQVEMYRDFWMAISGENVKEAGLYFIHEGRWVTV